MSDTTPTPNLIADGSITAEHIAVGSITADQINDNGNPTGAESAAEPFVPVAERTPEEQIAYWRDLTKRKERILKEQGDYEDLKAKADKFDALHQETQTEHEKALQAAREEAARAARIEALPGLISAELRARRVPADVANAQVELLDLTKFLTDTGELDTTRLDAVARPIVPAGHSPQADFGRVGGSAGAPGKSLTDLASARAAELSTTKQ